MPRTEHRYTPGLSADRIRTALLDRAEDLFHAAFGPPVRTDARDWRARENPALAMCMRGPKRGLWMDHSADAGGDLMDLVALVFCGLPSARSDFQRVLEEAARFAGVDGEAPQPAPKQKSASSTGDDARQQAYLAALLDALLSRARPMSGSRSEAYLASRGITHLPEEGLNDLPPVPGLPVRSAHLPSLVAWATTGGGAITGGQRILLRDDGRAADVGVRKPAFGRISGRPARFLPETISEAGPFRVLIIAEGPETALAIRQACGCETWAIFGVSGWKTAPVPSPQNGEDRDVILAPDQDAPKSPAGRAFARAVKHHLDEHCRFRIAEAPEPEGSKRDMADTLLCTGEDAVRQPIAEAIPAQQFLQARRRRKRKDKEAPDAQH